MTSEPVILINAFEVPAGADEDVVLGRERGRDFLRTQDGFRSTRLHRSLAPTADLRYVTSPDGRLRRRSARPPAAPSSPSASTRTPSRPRSTR